MKILTQRKFNKLLRTAFEHGSNGMFKYHFEEWLKELNEE